MSNVWVVVNSEGVREILRGAEMQALCHEEAQDIANSLGDGYEVTDYVGKNRCNSSVVAVSKEAIKDNLENNTLLKGLNK